MPDFMDEAKNLAGEHSDVVDKGLDRAEQEAENKTGGKYDSQIQDAGQKAEGFLGSDNQGDQSGQGSQSDQSGQGSQGDQGGQGGQGS